ncbi:hypothetical protein NKR23_g4666 [Pleurostoma richardsiae]|uniref:Uncharacterized protein n=1 Tax=Pleurostoma richardsiae TaxID=41990 RepID=A0AA38RVA8_9PEZI|nr:hypothetical protein NKR23_g4666 [Pleurostoma richardsiae]
MSLPPLSYLLSKAREINIMMPSRPKSAASVHSATSDAQAAPPSTQQTSSRGDEDDFEVEELPDEGNQKPEEQQRSSTPGTSMDSRSKSPAYVEPIPKIPHIPRIQREGSPTSRRSIPQFIKDHLVGKRIDEFGDVIDEATGKVLGRVAGDLPSMVGRSILNQRGDVLGDDGELLGYVAEVETEGEGTKEVPRQGEGPRRQPSPSPTRSIDEYMNSRGNAGAFRVDLEGNILDADGNIVGSFHDKNTGFGKPAPKDDSKSRTPPAREEKKPEQEERPPNAQAFRKENADESPSDIFLDVKSTTEGIQLTIRIPTVFPGGGQPRVSIS